MIYLPVVKSLSFITGCRDISKFIGEHAPVQQQGSHARRCEPPRAADTKTNELVEMKSRRRVELRTTSLPTSTVRIRLWLTEISSLTISRKSML